MGCLWSEFDSRQPERVGKNRAYSLVVRRYIRIVQARVRFSLGPPKQKLSPTREFFERSDKNARVYQSSRRSMDRMAPSEGADVGSIPAGRTKKRLKTKGRPCWPPMLHLCRDSAPEAEEAKLHRSFRYRNLMHHATFASLALLSLLLGLFSFPPVRCGCEHLEAICVLKPSSRHADLPF